MVREGGEDAQREGVGWVSTSTQRTCPKLVKRTLMLQRGPQIWQPPALASKICRDNKYMESFKSDSSLEEEGCSLIFLDW